MVAMSAIPSPTPHRLGVYLVSAGASVSVWAPHAVGVELCLFDATGVETRIPLVGPEAGAWHAWVPGITAGQRYGFRATGPWDPSQGHVYNRARLLLDPYARGIDGAIAHESTDGSAAFLSRQDDLDSAPFVPRGVVLAPSQVPAETGPRVSWADTIIYEAHVKGLTHAMTDIPAATRGTYAALGHDAVVNYLRDLGVTTLELLPIHAFATETHLEKLRLDNYWGYNTLGFFAPHAPYATAAARDKGAQGVADELRAAIAALHRGGIEVILDVVYNHTCEGGAGGRQVSWRGLDNRAYYRHLDGQPGVLDDTTGTGNTLDFGEPRVVQMALDSLRYWITDYGVDGFRFDLATTLGRTGNGFEPRHPFLVGITTDPVIGRVKLIAEPWDLGLGGWQTGAFPAPMAEWNDRFRDSTRTFWLTDAERALHKKSGHGVQDLATRLAGSSDVFGHGDPPLSRGPMASINFVTAHDGFTLSDLTAYHDKHNEANGEGGLDGSPSNGSWNHGAEGPTDDEAILSARHRTARNLLGTLLLSAGVPMIVAGDEMGRTQGGNNNAYCQDNELSWLDWTVQPWTTSLRATTAYLVQLRKEHPALRPTTFYEGRDRDETRRDDLAWFSGSGQGESEQWWHDSSVRVLQMMRSLAEGSDALIVINGYASPASVVIPGDDGPAWRLAWDSSWESPESGEARAALAAEAVSPGSTIEVDTLSMRLYLSAPQAG
jgi:glycogen operon protein